MSDMIHMPFASGEPITDSKLGFCTRLGASVAQVGADVGDAASVGVGGTVRVAVGLGVGGGLVGDGVGGRVSVGTGGGVGVSVGGGSVRVGAGVGVAGAAVGTIVGMGVGVGHGGETGVPQIGLGDGEAANVGTGQASCSAETPSANTSAVRGATTELRSRSFTTNAGDRTSGYWRSRQSHVSRS